MLCILQDLQEQLKSVTRITDESIDEGYGDSNSINASSVSLDIPSSSLMNSVLLNNAVDVLARSKDFALPMQEKLSALRSKMEILRDQCDALNQRNLHSSVNNVISPRDSTQFKIYLLFADTRIKYSLRKRERENK